MKQTLLEYSEKQRLNNDNNNCKLQISVNGKKLEMEVGVEETVLTLVRRLHLRGTKNGCSEGGCGACTVLYSHYNNSSSNNKSDNDEVSADKKLVVHKSINACLTPVHSLISGSHILTIEGLTELSEALNNGEIHPIQERMVELHGSQCGYCTPGIIMALFANYSSVSPKNLVEEMDGNLCRCTGYRPIWDVVHSLNDVEDLSTDGCKGCSNEHNPEECDQLCSSHHHQHKQQATASNGLHDDHDHACGNGFPDKSETKIIVSSTKDKVEYYQKSNGLAKELTAKVIEKIEKLVLENFKSSSTDELSIFECQRNEDGRLFLKPKNLNQAFSCLSLYDGVTVVAGNTEVGIEVKFKKAPYNTFMTISNVSELQDINFEEVDGVKNLAVGGGVTLSKLMDFCHEQQSFNLRGASTFDATVKMLRWFASSQIRNVATLAGNIATASPISDMNPVLLASGAKIIIGSPNGHSFESKTVALSEFFLSYRRTKLGANQLILKILIPLTDESTEYIVPFKQARRREDDISIVSACMRVKLQQKNESIIISSASFAFGGVAPIPFLIKNTDLTGKAYDSSLNIFDVQSSIMKEINLIDSAPGGQVEFRKALVMSFLNQFFHAINCEVKSHFRTQNSVPLVGVHPDAESVLQSSFMHHTKPIVTGTQTYEEPRVIGNAQNNIAVGKSSTHASGKNHCTGDAIYTDDIKDPLNLAHAALIMSKHGDCNVKSVDVTKVKELHGVIGVYLYEDLVKLGGSNKLGPVVKDEVVFVKERVLHVGSVIGVVVAASTEIASKGADLVEVEYSNINPNPIVSIHDALKAGSFYENTRHTIEKSNVAAFLDDDDHITVSGEVLIGGQEHFYLETNSTLVIPTEDGLDIFTSTQSPSKTQQMCASASNTPAHKVVVKMKRMGGGFGGKETRTVFAATAVAVAAKLCKRPVKLTLDRNIDMSITGQRHSFFAKYKASVKCTEGFKIAKLAGLEVELYSNGGCGLDLSGPIMDRALFHIDGPYNWQAIKATGVVCKTIQPPHTAFRGFGGPQGIAVCETVIDHLAAKLQLSSAEIDRFRFENLYRPGDITHFGTVMEGNDWNTPKAMEKVMVSSDLNRRRELIEKFNSENTTKKRGISVIPTKFGIAFTAKFMNQGGAIVHLYLDGTVLVSHGGTEMGQGLHTKVCQVAAQAFGIPLGDVHVADTATDKVANTIPTAASQSTDLYGMATLDACNQILARIKPIKDMYPNATLQEIATKAHFERIDLSAHGFFIVPNDRCGYDWDMDKPEGYRGPDNAFRGRPFNYFTQGAAVSEVEIDTLTGNHRNIRTDIIVDVGQSINPAIDIGQIEGAFIQGVGWCTIEEMIWGDEDHLWVRPRGKLFTQGPGAYKIPAFNDTPEKFNVELMRNVKNPFAIHSSRGIGEPPFALGLSVFFAIKDAIRAARLNNDDSDSCRIFFQLNLPATSERIRMGCMDEIVAGSLTGDGKMGFQPKGSF